MESGLDTLHKDESSKVNSRPRVQSVARAISILTLVAESDQGLRAMEIAKRLGFARQATYHLLHTLVGCRMLVRNSQNRYVLGLQVATLADSFMRHLAPPEHLAPLVRRIATETGETAYAAGWRDGEIVNLLSVPGNNAIQAMTVPQGYSQHAHARATGKLLLAHVSPEIRAAYLDTHDMQQRTPNTLSTLTDLQADLDRIREAGYAIDHEEFSVGVCCIAVPVRGASASFALGFSAPVDRYHTNFDKNLQVMLHVAEGL